MSEETIPQMREAIEAKDKEIQTLNSEVETLGGKLRASDAREAFRDAGYNPKHGTLFAQSNPEGDITPELVSQYADDWDLSPLAEEGSTQEEGSTTDADDGTDALASLERGGSRAGEGGSGSSEDRTYTRQEWLEMRTSDPAKAAAVLNQGRVETSQSGNFRSDHAPVSGANPYVPLAE